MDVYLDRRLPDYFREHDWARITRTSGAPTPFDDFLAQRLVVISGYDLSALDLDFLAGLDFPQTWQFKKLQAAGLDSRISSTGRMVLRDAFRGDKRAYKRFVAQVHELERIVHELLAAILPCEAELVNVVTRFSETRMENLHFDLDEASDDHEAVRLYINLDRAPRIWATSYQLTELVRGGGQRLVKGIDPARPSEKILGSIVLRAFGGWHQRATERIAPRHLVYIDPGDVFVIDGRCISHQVMSGHRVCSVYAKVRPDGARVRSTFGEKLRAALADAQRVPVGQETSIVNYFDSAQLKPAPQLKEQWGAVFGDTRTGRIRRFDDSGLAGS